ncbi:MAG TPA: SPOR domain-containing protein, partial [Longimicrobiaceae bacterium]
GEAEAASAVAWSPRPAAPAYAPPPRYAAADPLATGGPGEEDEGGPYSLQVGDYAAEDRALAVLDRLADRGYSPFIVSGVDRRGRLFFHVRVERFDERAEAGDAALRFARREGMPATVVPSEYALP